MHDCFTIAEIVAIEDLGFVPKGAGRSLHVWRAARACNGERPVNASGGLKSKGHPVGATGVGQICDVVQQIRGEAGERQVKRQHAGAGAEPGRIGRHQRGHRFWGPHERFRSAGTVYTETVVYSPPEAYVNDVPYQLAIVELDGGRRVTARVDGERAHIGDRVSVRRIRDGVPFFRKTIMKLAERMNRIGVESAFEVLVRARALEAQGRDIIHLEIGEPDFDTPRHIVEAGKKALDEGWTHYGPTQGLPELREAIAAYICRTRGIRVGAGARVRGARRQADHLFPDDGAAGAGR